MIFEQETAEERKGLFDSHEIKKNSTVQWYIHMFERKRAALQRKVNALQHWPVVSLAGTTTRTCATHCRRYCSRVLGNPLVIVAFAQRRVRVQARLRFYYMLIAVCDWLCQLDRVLPGYLGDGLYVTSNGAL